LPHTPHPFRAEDDIDTVSVGFVAGLR
jgi:hypothetical protein